MHSSALIEYKYLSVYSDGCLNFNAINISKYNKKIFIYKKDHKLFKKLLKNTSLIKKTNKYRNKIF